MTNKIDTLVRDLCSVEFRTKSKTRKLIEEFVKANDIKLDHQKLREKLIVKTLEKEKKEAYIDGMEAANKRIDQLMADQEAVVSKRHKEAIAEIIDGMPKYNRDLEAFLRGMQRYPDQLRKIYL